MAPQNLGSRAIQSLLAAVATASSFKILNSEFPIKDSFYLSILVFWIPFFSVLFVFDVFVYPFYLSPLRHLPEPKGGGGILAHGKELAQSWNGAPYRKWIETVPNNGLIRFRVLFNEERLFVVSPDAIRQITVTESYKWVKPPLPVVMFNTLLGNGILIAEGDEHKRQRKLLMPAFSFRHVKDLYQVFWNKAEEAADLMQEAIRQPHVSGQRASNVQLMYNWASRCTLDIIGVAGMDYDFKALSDPNEKLVSTYHELFANEPPFFYWLSFGIHFPIETFLKIPFPLTRKIHAAAATIKGVAYDLIRRKRAAAAKGMAPSVDILSVAIESGGFSDEDLANQLMTFLAAGHETTASAMSWTVYLMCKHQDLQKTLRAEIRDRLFVDGSPPETVDSVTIDSMPYLNAIASEVLRYMSSVPITIRVAAQDNMEIMGQKVPKGTYVMLAPWATNVDTQLWGDDATEFRPERWLTTDGRADKTGGASNNYALLTFLHGPRSCIGKDFARAELLCLMASWFGRFEMEWETPNLKEDFSGYVTARPKHHLPVKLKKI